MQPKLDQLFAQFLQRRVAAGGVPADEPAGEVLPHQAVMTSVLDPRSAFKEALEPAAHLLGKKESTAFTNGASKAPSDWSNLVRHQDCGAAIACCVGNFPQMVRSITPLLTATKLSDLKPKRNSRLATSENPEAKADKLLSAGRFGEAILAAATLRLAGQFESAASVLAKVGRAAPAAWQGLVKNEEAALAWHRGDADTALQLWESHADRDNPAVKFNRGVAYLFTNQPAKAAPLLAQAAERFAEDSGWHHLARLYQTLAESAA